MITLKTFNGHDLTAAGLRAKGLAYNTLAAAKPVFIEQVQADPDDAGTYTVDVRSVPIQISITDYVTRETLIGTIKGWFKRGTAGWLVATHSEDGSDYQLYCRVQSLAQEQNQPMTWTVILQTGMTAWISVSEETSSWSPTGTGGNKNITVGGNEETVLSLNATTTTAPTAGYIYQQLYQLVNVNGIAHGNRPWCLTLNTAALVTAGKMQADGDDLRVFVDNVEVNRWLANMNTTSKIGRA